MILMIEMSKENVLQPISQLFPEKLLEDVKQNEYSYCYAVKITLCRHNIIKWSEAQRLFSRYPIDSVDEEIVVYKHIKPGLEIGIDHFNELNLYDRRIDLVAICRNEIAALFLLSFRKEQGVDDITNTLGAFSRRIFSLRQFNKLSSPNSGSRLLRHFKVLIRQLEVESV
jgi:hypothetical protein